MTTTATFDARKLRDVLGTFVTGVTVVTTRDTTGAMHGVTANSFSSVSLDPPLVLWSQALASKSLPAFRDSDCFAVNILADDQVALSNHFAKSKDDKFSGIAHETGVGGVPVLQGTAAHLECTKVAMYEGGDHVVYMGRVEKVSHSSRRPLAFAAGRYMVPYAHDLGPMALGLGLSLPGHIDAVRTASDALQSISDAVGQHTLCLAVWGNHGPTAIRWEPGLQPVSDQLRTGLVMSLTRTATGRAFAAFMPPELTKSYVDEDLRLFADPELDLAAQRARFDAEIEEARAHGIARAVTAASPLHGFAVTAFSAPVYGRDGAFAMTLSLTSRADRLAPDWEGDVPTALKREAAALSERLKSR